MNATEGAQKDAPEVAAAVAMFSVEQSSDKSGLRLTPVKELIFENWLQAEPEAMGGTPTGGVEQAIENSDDWWNGLALAAIRAEGRTGRPFEFFTLISNGLAEPDHPSRAGAIIRTALRQGIIVRCFYAPSERPSRNKGVVGWYTAPEQAR